MLQYVELFNLYNQELLREINLKVYKDISDDLGKIYIYRRDSEIVYDTIIIKNKKVEKVWETKKPKCRKL